MLQSKNVRIMLVLLLVAFLYTFVFGCDDTGGGMDPVVFHDDGSIENLDTNIEKVVEPILDLGDDVVDAARDTLEEVIEWSYEATDDDDDDVSIHGVGF